jgi:hypothetical protein
VLKQLASLSRDGAVVRRAVDEAAGKERAVRPALRFVGGTCQCANHVAVVAQMLSVG